MLYKNSGDAGYRSRYLSHAKRALYHLSYIPYWDYHYEIVQVIQFLDSLVVRISACHVEGPGSIPGRGVIFYYETVNVTVTPCRP